ncbi:BTB/POZ domain-containing protein 2-like [Malaya genurostris]|uniref:BTB/POZ domain-containing protein 2-like n=1 Tax=Malaya genurostris TaxID=325434 RepID=UPI0026F3EC15|nr:BTB/POZ domain-containing protein 2-like [Malaya genurostris]
MELKKINQEIPISYWQCLLLDVKSRMKHLLETETMGDCEFLVGKEPTPERIIAHKFVLSVASPVFETMFYGSLADKKNEAIRILDIGVDDFKKMMTYIYTDKTEIGSLTEAMNIYCAGHKYLLTGLRAECRAYMKANIKADNACVIYEFSKFYEESDLMSECLTMMRKQTSAVITSNGFLDSDLNTVITILNQNELSVPSEIDLFKAVKQYAARNGISRAEQKYVKKVKKDGPTILDALHRIRFRVIADSNELAREFLGTELLTKSEVATILLCVSLKEAKHYVMPEGFSSSLNPRINPNVAKSSYNRAYGHNCPTCGRY